MKQQKLKYTSAGKTLVMVHEKKKYTFTGEAPERKEVKELIEKFNTRNSKIGLTRVLNKFTEKSEKKKVIAKANRKLAKKEIKTVKKEIKQLGSGINVVYATALGILKRNKKFIVKDKEAFLAPYTEVPMPENLVSKIATCIKEKMDLEPFIKFWELCLLNPNEKARTKLFDYLSHHNLLVTPNGYLVTYRMVKKTANPDVFTSAHTGEEEYRIGHAFSLDRTECDDNGAKDCSKGLHTGAPAFIGIDVGDGYGAKTVTNKTASPNSYGTGYDRPVEESDKRFDKSFGDQAVICLVNPMHVVSIPDSYTRKMRSCELYFAKLTTPEEVIDLQEKDYLIYDDAYLAYERVTLTAMLKETKLKNWVDKNKPESNLSKLTKAKKTRLEELEANLKLGTDQINPNRKVLTLSDINNIIKNRVKR